MKTIRWPSLYGARLRLTTTRPILPTASPSGAQRNAPELKPAGRCLRNMSKHRLTPPSLAVTDATPQDGNTLRQIKLCPLFFKHDRTKNNLDSKSYKGDRRGSWCQKGQRFRDFETAGHTILHEMTHLDALGEAAEMPAR